METNNVNNLENSTIQESSELKDFLKIFTLEKENILSKDTIKDNNLENDKDVGSLSTLHEIEKKLFHFKDNIFGDIQTELFQTIDLIEKMIKLIENASGETKELLIQNIQKYVKRLKRLDDFSKNKEIIETTIPLDVIKRMENDENNPELYTKELLEKCQKESISLKDHRLSLLNLRNKLQEGLNNPTNNPTDLI